jgi:hypothetical protein
MMLVPNRFSTAATNRGRFVCRTKSTDECDTFSKVSA